MAPSPFPNIVGVSDDVEEKFSKSFGLNDFLFFGIIKVFNDKLRSNPASLWGLAVLYHPLLRVAPMLELNGFIYWL